jgi:hypothetical protein
MEEGAAVAVEEMALRTETVEMVEMDVSYTQ